MSSTIDCFEKRSRKQTATLLREFSFGKGNSFMVSSLGFETLEYEGEYYCITLDALAVQKLTR